MSCTPWRPGHITVHGQRGGGTADQRILSTGAEGMVYVWRTSPIHWVKYVTTVLRTPCRVVHACQGKSQEMG